MTTPLVLPTWLSSTLLQGIQRGIEKESLRLDPNGHLSLTPHPTTLGSALTHPHITTDYSEALMELITPPLPTMEATLQFLANIHQTVYKSLPSDESLWPLSMPCLISDNDEDIPLAQYGSSNIGKLKTLYRKGLGVRYGRKMQTIAGIHYNISFPDALFSAWQQAEQPTADFTTFKNEKYLGLIRNFKRLVPLVIYLIGASPSVCACFVSGRKHQLQHLTPHTLYLPHATSLRMGKLGYQNSVQEDLNISYNNLHEYQQGIAHALHTPFSAFIAKGIDDAHGQPMQINGNILQIENEYYAPIRAKQPTQAEETPSAALMNRGIGYVELRAIDLDPFSPIGISLETAAFLEVLAAYALFSPSPLMTANEQAQLQQQLDTVVNAGRNTAQPWATTASGTLTLGNWMHAHLDNMYPIAQQLDACYAVEHYTRSLNIMQQRVQSPENTPSAQVLQAVNQAHCHAQFGLQLAQRYKQQFLEQTPDTQIEQYFTQCAEQSHAEQLKIEATDTIPFSTFLARYRN